MQAQLGVLDQTRLDVVSARNDSEQARIGWCLVIAILDQHSHFATGALQAYRHRQSQEIIGCTRRRLMLHRQIKRPGEQPGQAAPRERDVDAIDLISTRQSSAVSVALALSGARPPSSSAI